MELTHFAFDVEDGVATVLLDRAGEPVNTLGPAIFDDFIAVIDRIETDPSIKAVVFGVLVAVAGCLRGMQCGNSSQAVGMAATSAVVTSIVLIIVADGLFAVILNVLGI